MKASRIYHHITNRATTVSSCLIEHFKQTHDSARELIALGAIYSNRLRVLEDRELPKGTYLRLHLAPKRYPSAEISWRSRLVAVEKDFVVIDKPAGIPTHATVDNVRENALAETRSVVGEELFSTQRLDVPVSGLLVFARNKAFQSRFNQWLSDKKIGKHYATLTKKNVVPGHYVHYTENSERIPRRFSVDAAPGWLRCELKVLASEVLGDAFLSEVELLTGRTHQIRGQLSCLGAPLLGDNLYGGQRLKGAELGLRCVKLEWGKNRYEVPAHTWAEAFLARI